MTFWVAYMGKVTYTKSDTVTKGLVINYGEGGLQNGRGRASEVWAMLKVGWGGGGGGTKSVEVVLTRELDLFVCLFVFGISLTSGQLVSELFPDCTKSCFSQVVLRRRGGDCIYEMKWLFVAVGLNVRFIVLPHWDNMS